MTNIENEKKNKIVSKELIKSILDSNELNSMVTTKLKKFKNTGTNLRFKNEYEKLEEGYESSDSDDSKKSYRTSSSMSESDATSLNSDTSLDLKSTINESEKFPYLPKIKKGIEELKTKLNNKINYNNRNLNNEDEINNSYPLEFLDIFPKIKKFEINNQSLSQDLIEKPIFFIKNLILKIYHESLSFAQDEFHLQNFKNGPDYNYKILNMSKPHNLPSNNENITCMITGSYKNNNTDKKNKEIINFHYKISQIRNNQNTFCNFIFFGYKNGDVIQYALVNLIPDEKSISSLPTINFFKCREYNVERIIKEEKIDKHVLCMSLSDDENFLLVGYASGHIILWKTTNGKIHHCFEDIFDMPVVSCEFLSVSENKNFLFLASDLIGKVRLIKYTKNKFIDNHSIIIVSNYNYPCLLIKRLRFNSMEQSIDFDINEIIQIINKKPHICLLGSLEYIQLIMIDRFNNNINNLLLIKNPDFSLLVPMTEEIKKNGTEIFLQNYIRDNFSKIEFPDSCFGLGFIGDLINNYDNEGPNILLAIAWKNRITLYLFSKNLSSMLEIGWYMNNSPIIKIGFIDTSLIYFIDKNNIVKIINTKLFNQSKVSMAEENNNQRTKNKFIIPISDIINLENPIKTISKTFTETINFYNPFVINTKSNIILIEEYGSSNDKNNINQIHLLSFQEFFNDTMRNLSEEKTKLFFSKFIDILKTNTNTFSLIPEDKNKKENLLINTKPNKFVKGDYFEKCLSINFQKKERDYSFLSEAIEFSIEIGSLDFIYNEIKKLQQQRAFKENLVFHLEPYILNNKFLANNNLISEELINEIINFYLTKKIGLNGIDDIEINYENIENVISGENKESISNIVQDESTPKNDNNKSEIVTFDKELIKNLTGKAIDLTEKIENELSIENGTEENKIFKLDFILCHLNIETVKKIKNIDEIIKNNKLYCSLIYYYTNVLKDFMTPLNYLFDEFKSSQDSEIQNKNISYFYKGKHSRGFYKDNFSDLIKSLKTGEFNFINNFFIKKEYIGHLLLFFIQLTLKGILFPYVGKINLDIYDSIIPEMFLFLTKKDVASILINFDSFSYFDTLSLFIVRENEVNKIHDNLFNDKKLIQNEENIYENRFCPSKFNKLYIEKFKLNINQYNDKDKNKEKELEEKQSKLDNKNNQYFFELIYNILDLCEKQDKNVLIKFDVYFFIIKISLKIEGISKKIIEKSLISIFNFYNEIKKYRQSMDFDKIDKFICHYSIIRKKTASLDELSLIINSFIQKYYINDENLNRNDTINYLLKMCSGSYFFGVKIYLYELKKDYLSCVNIYLNENRKKSRGVFSFINKTLNNFKQNKDEKNLQWFKNEIKKKISNLAGVSNSGTFKIIQQWYNSIDIISNLNNLPVLQFKYIEKIKSIYKRKLKNEKSIESANDKTKAEYSEILKIYIKLLLYFEKEKRVLKILKEEEEYINVKDCLKICLNKSLEASLYLYRLIGDEKSSLKICFDKIDQDYKTIKENANDSDLCSDLLDEIKKLIDESIKICEYNSEISAIYRRRSSTLSSYDISKGSTEEEGIDMGEDYWLELFGKLYNILNDADNKNLLIFSKIKSYLSQEIENLLITMSYYVDFGLILKRISNELEFSLLKKFLNKIFYTKSHLSNLYNSYINLLSDKINKSMNYVEETEQKGKNIRLIIKGENENEIEKEKVILERFNKYNFNYNYTRSKELEEKKSEDNEIKKEKNPKIFKKCSLCSNMLNFIDPNYDDNSSIIIFKCEHIYHINCLLKENKKFKQINYKESYCPKCVDINNEIFSFNNIDNEKVDENEINIKEDELELDNNKNNKKINNASIEKRIKKKEDKMKRKNWKKLNLLDNNYFEQLDILESTLNGI